MTIKVQCPCGTKFAFDVEPIHGRMPVRVACPACNADATDLANAAIAAQVASPADSHAGAPKIRIRAATPPPAEPAPAPDTGSAAESTPPRVRLAGAPEAAAPASGEQSEVCPHHPTEPAVEHCRVCGRPICLKCMEMFGYVCSVFCRTKAEREHLALPRYALQRSVLQQAARARARLVMLAIAAGMALLLAGWIWWAFFGTKPRVTWSLKIPRNERGTIYEMLGPNQVLALKERQLALLDIDQGREIWATPIEGAKPGGVPDRPLAGKKAAPKPSAGPTPEVAAGELATDAARAAAGQAGAEEEEEDEEEWLFRPYDAPTILRISGGTVWLRFPDRLASYDVQTGTRKQEVPLKQPVSDLTHSAAGIVAVSGDERGVRTVTYVTLPAGAVKTEQIAPMQTARPPQTRSAANARAAAAALGVDESELSELEPVRLFDDFLPAGANVVGFKTRLIEHRTVWREAMKPKPEKSIMDSGRLSAGQSLDAVQELMNEMTRSGGDKIEEDVSRFQVTLRRFFSGDVPAWNGEVIGPPSFFPLQTVDVVCGAKQVIVLDKANKVRWQATNTFNLERGFSLGAKDEEHFPCVETADALYLFDQGMLTCFELKTGQARWRMTSVGITRVQLDGEGKLYVNTTTASPDVIDFPKQINIFEKVRPVILKVDPATGKVLWRVENIADLCILSGEYVYAARSSSGVYGAGTYFNLYRLNPDNGKKVWNYHQERWPRNTGYHGRHFMMQWKDEVQVLKFLTL